MHKDKNLMLQAIHEIQQLRRSNEILGAKVDVMELFGLVFRTAPKYGNNCVTEDIAWAMQRRIDEIDAVSGNSRTTVNTTE